MKQLGCLCFNCARVDGVSSGPCVFTSQLPILREKVPFVIIATRLGKILLCLACARCCGRRSVHTRVMVRHLGPSLASGYKVVDTIFLHQMSVLKSLRGLSTFLESSQQLLDDYCELVILSLRDISPFAYHLWQKNPGNMHKTSKLLYCVSI